MRARNARFFAIGLGLVLVVLALAQAASATHVRPVGASPWRSSLVPAYKACDSPNATRPGPGPTAACVPPVESSSNLTVGTPDANGAGANSSGFARYSVIIGDVLIEYSVTDVRCKPGTSAAVCTTANAADGPDYSGSLGAAATTRITDHRNGSGGNQAGTPVDIPFFVWGFTTFPCGATADTTIGSTCSTTTSANALWPGAIFAGARIIAQKVSPLEVYDGGPDGNANTSENSLFMEEGVFIP
jgi:hypothetical protein